MIGRHKHAFAVKMDTRFFFTCSASRYNYNCAVAASCGAAALSNLHVLAGLSRRFRFLDGLRYQRADKVVPNLRAFRCRDSSTKS